MTSNNTGDLITGVTVKTIMSGPGFLLREIIFHSLHPERQSRTDDTLPSHSRDAAARIGTEIQDE